MIGQGLFLRDNGTLPPSFRNLLKEIGEEKVSSLLLVRTPLSKATTFLLNLASFGQLKDSLKSTNIDKLFHLSLLINGKYTLEKNEVLTLKASNPIKNGSETLNIPLNGNLTIQELIDKAKSFMGDADFTSYDAKNNNCSIFLASVLKANHLGNYNAYDFINQKTDELFNSFPSLSKILVDLGTIAGAIVDRQIQGEGSIHLFNFGLRNAQMCF